MRGLKQQVSEDIAPMLVVTRKTDNRGIIITTASGEKIRLIVSDIRGNIVSLGFEADESIEILREELINRGGKVRTPGTRRRIGRTA